MLSRRPKVLVIDVGGTHVKVLARNAKLLKTLPAGVRRGDKTNAFLGGLRLWDDRLAHADGVRAHDAQGRRSRGLGRERG